MRSLVTIDVEGTLAPEHYDSQDPYRSVDVLDRFLEAVDIPVTLFVTPGVVAHSPETVARWHDERTTIGLHVHPAQLGGDSDWLTDYERDEIEAFVADGLATFADHLDAEPDCFRAGRWAYTDRLLAALAAQGVDLDASRRPSRSTAPYERHSVGELPMTVWSNPLVRTLLSRRSLEMVPLHADAFLRSWPYAVVFYGLTWRLLQTDRPYLMVSCHDYDLLAAALRGRFRRYTAFLAARSTPVAIDSL